MENALVERLGRFFVGGYRAFFGVVLVCVYIRCCGNGFLGFRPYGGSLLANAPKVTKRSLTLTYGPSLRLGVPSLRDRSGGIAYGLLRCTSSRCMRLRRTVAALPPPDQSLHSACRRALRSKAVLELTLIVLSGEGRVFGFGFVVGLPLTPALSPRRGGRFLCFSKLEFDSVLHVGVALPYTSISSLSLRAVRRFGRDRVRGGLLIWLLLWLLIFCPFGRPSGGVHQGGGAQRRAAKPHTSRGGAAKQTVGDAP